MNRKLRSCWARLARPAARLWGKGGAIPPGSARLYYKGSAVPPGSAQFRCVDLRSDTVTKPGPAMRSAMAQAQVGDDVYGEDPTVYELERRGAELFGMEATLFVPSGTMGNLISVMCHCRERGAELVVGDQAHVHLYEQGGIAQLAGIHSRTVKNLPDGTFDLREVKTKLRDGYPDPHYPRSRLICVENTHNVQGGRVLPLAFLREVCSFADEHDVAVHMDGARVMNAAVALGVPASEILQYCDSVSVCLSKGLGAPVGSLVGGRREFIKEARRARKVLGGGMRQAGILAAAGLIAITDMVERLGDDHRNARTFAEGILKYAPPFCSTDLSCLETNILMFSVEEPRIAPQELCDRLSEVSEDEVSTIGQGVRVLMFPMYGRVVRAVWHCDVSAEDTELAVQKLDFVIQKYKRELTTVQ
ncbi:threonine aldolase 1 [Latimeria chalumnae]|uniref:Threonine aldolase 1 n=1 Tax=Latimeria chalumnae TaxID=7897 RepID=H3BDH3_LATCH|nr:PREDICTED: probable low-specificity L-threonine aldolase 2 [Latimeria chalumnae]|eukprot:XP_005989151.1 PREDICTED: probable low-specificity L-threonine aldolase 2 [Latimeria chalumnae]